MKYNAFKSIVNSRKTPVELKNHTSSFFISVKRVTPYVEPNFSKTEFPTEKPQIILVSAVGASGKTTTASALSFDTKLPVLDLSKHKPVGDNTLTGILTSAYPIDKVGAVLEGLRDGTHGIIIDGIDEARTKTTERGFEAFLDDLIERSKGASSTAIVVFGRGQILLSTWCYLVDRGADVGVVQIDPFDLDQAKNYIDSLATEKDDPQKDNYNQARDAVLNRLNTAFQASKISDKNTFLSFVGYPPVLDAIATLLRTERNFHRIQQALTNGAGEHLENDLLVRISDYLLNREHDEKAVPNFINAIIEDVDEYQKQSLRESLYNKEEQCARILAYSLSKEFSRKIIDDSALNDRYEQAVANWFQEHPFLDGKRVRNVVFSAIAIANCVLSDVKEYQNIAYEYAQLIQPTYHLLQIMNELSKNNDISVNCFNMLMQSCSEFLGLNAQIQINIDGESWDEQNITNENTVDLTLLVALPDENQEHTFTFQGNADTEVIILGPYLINADITIPFNANLSNSSSIEVIGECSLSAKIVNFDTPDLILREIPNRTDRESNRRNGLFVNAMKVQGQTSSITFDTGNIQIQCIEHSLVHPLAKYTRKVDPPISDKALMEKYRRLRRIFSEFASHSKGRLAKYRDKIEHKRVLRNRLGDKILEALVKEGIFTTDQKFYYVDADQCDVKLGISWNQLREYKSSSTLEAFLRGIS